jgi:hypothetical protein
VPSLCVLRVGVVLRTAPSIDADTLTKVLMFSETFVVIMPFVCACVVRVCWCAYGRILSRSIHLARD